MHQESQGLLLVVMRLGSKNFLFFRLQRAWTIWESKYTPQPFHWLSSSFDPSHETCHLIIIIYIYIYIYIYIFIYFFQWTSNKSSVINFFFRSDLCPICISFLIFGALFSSSIALVPWDWPILTTLHVSGPGVLSLPFHCSCIG